MDVSIILHQSIYIGLHIINLKTRSNHKVILFFIIELLSFDITNIEMDANAYCIYLQSSISNTNADIPIPSLKIIKSLCN